MKPVRNWLLTTAGVLAAAPSLAANLSIRITLPEIASNGPRGPNRPYVAVWLRKEDNSFAADLAVWYQIESPRRRGPAPPGGGMGPPPGMAPPPGFGSMPAGGARWLNEVRQWWADSGHNLQFPVDGLTSASRAAGTHELTFTDADPKLAKLPPGKYKLMLEAAREHGGDEVVSIPITLPLGAAQSGKTTGRSELGAVEFVVTP